MAEKLNTRQLQPDDSANGPPRISGFSEIGASGLKVAKNYIYEESLQMWRMPERIKTADLMMLDPAVAAMVEFYITMLSKVPWYVKPPLNATPTQKERAKFVASCKDDMDQSWEDFICSVFSSSIPYGFAINEKVYKRRLKKQSRYDDGLVGISGLPVRAISTSYGWEFSGDGDKLTAWLQTLQNLQYGERYVNRVVNTTPIKILREKFLLFRTSPKNNNPEGTPLLKACYNSWKAKKEIENQEMVGICRDLGGLLKVTVPSVIMGDMATPDQKKQYEEWKTIVRNVAVGEQSGVILPSDRDTDSSTPLYDMSLLTSTGAKSFDTNAIIKRYTGNILITFFADILQLGSEGGGSFALSDNKKSLIDLALERRLKEVQSVLNHDLIPQLFAMNGWDDSDYPTFEFDSTSKPSLDVISAFIQRVTAVGAIEVDTDLLNYTRGLIGLDPHPEGFVPTPKTPTSRSGDGMVEGLPGGTGKADGKTGDPSVANTSNAP